MMPYQHIFPDSREPTMTINLSRKVGRVPKGSYTFFESYCTDPACDCRRTTLFVINEKSKQKAAICFGFDPAEPMAGPFLDDFQEQAPYADELLAFFVDAINENPEWLTRMYDQYRAVRRKVGGKTYRGKPFPKPGTVRRRVTQPPDLEPEIEHMLKQLAASVRSSSNPRSKKAGRPAQPGLFDRKEKSQSKASSAAVTGMASFLERYLRPGHVFHAALQNELHHYLLTKDTAGDDLARLLAASFADEKRADASLRLLFDSLEILRAELERSRPGSRQRMERLQNALAQRIIIEQDDPDLSASVTHTLLQSRVEILPVLHDANNRRMLKGAEQSAAGDLSGDEIAAGLCRSIEEMGLSSPFEGMEAMLQLFALGDPGVQIALSGSMLTVGSPFIRDIVVLMLFHPAPEVRQGVSELLAESPGGKLTPESLRRLIVSRNWFPEDIRKTMDQAVSNARKARVECAPLPKLPSLRVQASVVDGAGAQSFQVIIPDGKGFSSCALLLKQGVGVADAFVVPLKTKRELNDFLALMKNEAAFIESTPDYLDLRVCQALAEGASLAKAPNFWLVHIAELLGRDQWRGVSFDPRSTLAQLREELASAHPALLSDREVAGALAESADWPETVAFAFSWFEDDAALDREVEKTQGRKKALDPGAAIVRILQAIMEKRRAVWLERLVLTTLWLKSSPKPPVPWHRMFHVAQALSDQTVPLKDIPLMHSIAEQSLRAHLGRKESRG